MLFQKIKYMINKQLKKQKMHYTKIKNRYYKITCKHKQRVSKKKFYIYIKNKLKTSIYKTQYNDFYFLKVPKENKYVPVDYLLKNIVLLLWKNGIETLGWDQSHKYSRHCAFISFINNKENERKIRNLFGKTNRRVIVNKKYSNFMSISFNYKSIPWMHNKLKLKIPTRKNAYPGYLISFYVDNKTKKNRYFLTDKFKNAIK